MPQHLFLIYRNIKLKSLIFCHSLCSFVYYLLHCLKRTLFCFSTYQGGPHKPNMAMMFIILLDNASHDVIVQAVAGLYWSADCQT